MPVGHGQPIVLGITGGVASGKSTVTGIFAELGARRASADEIAREVLAPGTDASKSVIEHFGPDFALERPGAESRSEQKPAAVDREKLARRIFSDERARRELEAIVHPAIVERMGEIIAEARADPQRRLLAFEIPLLYELGLETMVDRVLVALCDEPVQIERLKSRHAGMTDAEALRRLRSQVALSEKARRADFVVDTDRPIEAVISEVRTVFEQLAGGG